ncbi:hypothetical protein SAMN05421509_10730 [Chromohalobacter canadensis]|uniref:Uncharacterized protein n=1 Tax=Chromohalobacter canadensis TaxID=141389 RepID=A0A285VRB1_9GAMM|nr:hypothetical protein [Chromohalobacter canadensis]SOC56417.1 hypothetical protein SAMN05421509_10730 [Chromohalobacter canadensis]
MWNPNDLNKALVFYAILCGAGGWAIVEFVLWVISHINITVG